MLVTLAKQYCLKFDKTNRNDDITLIQFNYKHDECICYKVWRRVDKIMRKRLISICIILIILFSIYGCTKKADNTFTIESENTETENTEATNTDIVEEERKWQTLVYGEPVTVVEKVAHYYVDESNNFCAEYEYNSAGNQIKVTNYSYDGSIEYWYEYEYDSAGNHTKTVKYRSDGGIMEWSEYAYDNTGKKTRFMSYDVDGSIIDWYEYEYDDEGNMTEEINCSKNDSTYFRTEYKYDNAGNLEKETGYYLSHRIEHEYITITPVRFLYMN